MALKPSAPSILVTPTGNNDAPVHPLSGGVVLHHDEPALLALVVVEAVGSLVHAEVRPGDVAHYNDYIELFDKHVVPEAHLVAFEDSE